MIRARREMRFMVPGTQAWVVESNLLMKTDRGKAPSVCLNGSFSMSADMMFEKSLKKDLTKFPNSIEYVSN